MPTTMTNTPDLGRKNLQRGVELWDPTAVPDVCGQMVGEVIHDSQTFILMATYAGPDLPQTREPGQAPPETDYRQVARKQFSATKNIIKARIDDETMADNQYKDKMFMFGRDLRHNDEVKRQIDAANAFLNYCDVTTRISTIAGEAMASSTHALGAEAAFNYGATTYSNVMATPETPSASLLTKIRTMFSGEVNHKGFLDSPGVTFDVICSPTWTVIWQMILNSTGVYGDTSRPTNKPIQNFTNSIIENPRLTHAGWSVFRTTDKRRNPWFVYERQGFTISPTTGMHYAENDTYWMLAKSRRVFGSKDFRGVYFNLLGA